MSSRKKIYIKRIISDINEISSSYDPNIHIWYDENNITIRSVAAYCSKDNCRTPQERSAMLAYCN